MHWATPLGGDLQLPLHAGFLYRLGIGADHIAVAAATGHALVHIPFDEVASATTEGRGRLRSGGGFMGGGFGLDGALVGMAVSTALNALTARTDMESVLHLATLRGEAFFGFTESDPALIHRDLSRLRTWKLTQGEKSATSATDDDIVDRLERLVRLHAQGSLTDDEFAQQKTRLLRAD